MATFAARALLLFALASASGLAIASDAEFAFAQPADDAGTEAAVAALSDQVLAAHAAGRVQVPETGLAQLRIAAGRDGEAVTGIRALIDGFSSQGDHERARRWVPYLIHALACADDGGGRDDAYVEAFRAWFAGRDDLEAQRTQFWFSGSPDGAEERLRESMSRLRGANRVALADALGLAARYALLKVLDSASRVDALIAEDQAQRYLIDEEVLIPTPQGVTLSAVVARSRKLSSPAPAAMIFTIYTVPSANRAAALQAAARGYVGVVVDARGKRLGSGDIAPYEREAEDTAAAVEWIARQPWSDGRVAMYGGSYSGFSAWAATRRMPAALKTIVPYAAAIPGLGLPMENNVFLNANYAWPFHVAGSRWLDADTYSDRERWRRLSRDWYSSGRPYREIDQVDGTPNPWLQRWLSHPAYDAYWQAMVPYGAEFGRIDIPVLSITGYYDDGQISALQYFKEHHRHRPGAEHYLLIGPYDHFGTQAPIKPRNVAGYDIDPSAQFDTVEITFEWLDHVLRDGPLPALLRDRVNYQLMGADAWCHAPSLAAAGHPTAFHLSAAACGDHRCLSRSGSDGKALVQTVDFSDRATEGHPYYPYPVVRERLEVDSGFAFVSDPFERPATVAGTFSGELKVRIDRRDFDFSVSLYELIADGRTMQLSYYVGRASYARDMTRRELLVPGEWTVVPFERTRMTGRRMEAGSRLLVVVDVLKDANHQVNMGTGRDVSEESVDDTGATLRIEWHPDSVVRVPLGTDCRG